MARPSLDLDWVPLRQVLLPLCNHICNRICNHICGRYSFPFLEEEWAAVGLGAADGSRGLKAVSPLYRHVFHIWNHTRNHARNHTRNHIRNHICNHIYNHIRNQQAFVPRV